MTDRYACTQLGLHNVRHFWHAWPCPSFLVMVFKILLLFEQKLPPNKTLGGGGVGGGGGVKSHQQNLVEE